MHFKRFWRKKGEFLRLSRSVWRKKTSEISKITKTFPKRCRKMDEYEISQKNLAKFRETTCN